jgi:hypothetical protein
VKIWGFHGGEDSNCFLSRWRGRTVTWQNTNISENHAASFFRVKAAWFSETMVSYHVATGRHNSEDHDLRFLGVPKQKLECYLDSCTVGKYNILRIASRYICETFLDVSMRGYLEVNRKCHIF